MIITVSFIIGAALGASNARRKGGDHKDMALHGAIIGIIFALLGVFVSIVLARLI
ncbi:MAG: hypothetical protein ACC619_00600 [Paracoccaceae bacterium]